MPVEICAWTTCRNRKELWITFLGIAQLSACSIVSIQLILLLGCHGFDPVVSVPLPTPKSWLSFPSLALMP